MSNYKNDVVNVDVSTELQVGGRNSWHRQWQFVPAERLARQDLTRPAF